MALEALHAAFGPLHDEEDGPDDADAFSDHDYLGGEPNRRGYEGAMVQ